jgi:toxin YoeB
MIYYVKLSDDALDDIAFLKKSEPIAFKKVQKLISELEEHPRTGTGKPEALKYDLFGKWSRRINQKHRLVYEIHDTEVVVLVLSALDHYEK